MNSAYQELRRENYQFESQHIIMLIKFFVGITFLFLGVLCYIFSQRASGFNTNNETGTIKTENLAEYHFAEENTLGQTAINDNFVALSKGKLALTYSNHDTTSETSRIALFDESLNKIDFKDFKGTISNLIGVDTGWLFLLKQGKSTSLYHYAANGKLDNLTSNVFGGDKSVNSFIVKGDAVYFTTDKGLYKYSAGSIVNLSKESKLSIIGLLNDEILVSGNGGRIYSIINARLELKYENSEIVKPFISDNVLYHYTKQSGSYNLINTETKETAYTESDVYHASVIAGHTFINQQILMRLILCGQRVRLNLKLNNNKKEQVINLTCSFYLFFFYSSSRIPKISPVFLSKSTLFSVRYFMIVVSLTPIFTEASSTVVIRLLRIACSNWKMRSSLPIALAKPIFRESFLEIARRLSSSKRLYSLISSCVIPLNCPWITLGSKVFSTSPVKGFLLINLLKSYPIIILKTPLN